MIGRVAISIAMSAIDGDVFGITSGFDPRSSGGMIGVVGKNFRRCNNSEVVHEATSDLCNVSAGASTTRKRKSEATTGSRRWVAHGIVVTDAGDSQGDLDIGESR